jgi:hypothetical protein
MARKRALSPKKNRHVVGVSSRCNARRHRVASALVGSAWLGVVGFVGFACAAGETGRSGGAASEPDAFEIVELAPPTSRPVFSIRRRAPDAAPEPARGTTPHVASKDAPRPSARGVLRALGYTGGIAAYPPAGTEPLQPGLVVPDDFDLPDGYVRHRQVTDDGKQLPAILMFSPDYEFLDVEGRPMALPAGRIVPSELAPPGLALRMLEPRGRRDRD